MLALPLLIALVVAAVFGVYITFAPMQHGAGCLMMPFEVALCGNSAAIHLEHWQSAFAAVLANVFLLLALALTFIRPELFKLPERRLVTFSARSREPARPTLFQELFSRGILNSKIF